MYLNSDLSIQYAGGDSATGDYALDVLSIGGTVVQNMQLGIMYKTDVQEGILGVSYADIEFQVANGFPPYSNLPILLVQQGYIPSRAYSVWLNDDQGPSGSILFGGVDTHKYCGNLVTLPFVNGPGSQSQEFFVTLQGVQVTKGTGNPIFVNAGSTPVDALLYTETINILLEGKD